MRQPVTTSDSPLFLPLVFFHSQVLYYVQFESSNSVCPSNQKEPSHYQLIFSGLISDKISACRLVSLLLHFVTLVASRHQQSLAGSKSTIESELLPFDASGMTALIATSPLASPRLVQTENNKHRRRLTKIFSPSRRMSSPGSSITRNSSSEKQERKEGREGEAGRAEDLNELERGAGGGSSSGGGSLRKGISSKDEKDEEMVVNEKGEVVPKLV